MKVKKFVAPSMPEAMKQIRSELGHDAVILNSKVIYKGGLFGFFAKKNIEVIAAIDNDVKKQQQVQKKIEPKPIPNGQIREQVKGIKENEDLLSEIKELKSLMLERSSHDPAYIENYPEPINELSALLSKQEFDAKLRREILSVLLEKWYTNNANAEKKVIKQWLKDELKNKIEGFDYGGIKFTKKFINVVGPTGVGKTTTLAKIAAHCILKYKKKVAFITTDTYRIAAIDQLKTYAQILEVPVEVAYNIEDFKKAKEKFNSYDLVLIDTAGRNFRNDQYVRDLKTVIDFNHEMESFLVLSLASKYVDMEAIVEQFSLIHIDKFIFTKIDETTQYGSVFNLIHKYKRGVAYITNGQNVPDDIIEATPELIINTLYGVDEL